MMTDTAPSSTLRLVWPQWQGAATSSVRELAPEFPFDVARRTYAVGSAVLQAVLPSHDGPTVTVPVTMTEHGLEERDGLEAKAVLIEQLSTALRLIQQHRPARILTLGGDCSVSVAPFAALAERYGDDLAVVWVDSHPDVDTRETDYPGYHAMAVTAITGHGDPDVLAQLPGLVAPERVALAGVHDWTDDALARAAEWGLTAFGPEQLRTSSRPLLDWVAATGCSTLAIHFDVDTIDSREVVLGLGALPDGLSTEQARRVVSDLASRYDVVGLTVAEFIPRQVVRLQRLLAGFPLLSGEGAGA